MKYTKKSYRSKIGYILTWKSMGNFSFSFFISSIGYTKIYQILSMFFMCISYDDCHFWHIIVVISNLPFLAYHRCRRVKTPDKKRILKKKKKNQELLHYALYENIVNKWCLFQKSDFQVSLTLGTWSNFGGNG